MMNNDYIEKINNKLNEYLKPVYPNEIYNAMAYSVNAGGKRLRPIILIAACEALGGCIDEALPFACSIEMIHTYSLIHDDLPALDNDELRRGKPTCHMQFDEAIAILAGDSLLNMAYEIMSSEALKAMDKKFLKAMSFIAQAAGTKGMIGGQVVDILSESKIIDADTLIYIHKNKTAALIKAALKAGAAIGGADNKILDAFDLIGEKIGIAFQIKDDILDVTSTEEILGKPVLSDEKNSKNTYVSIYGLEKAQSDYNSLSAEGLKLIAEVSGENSFLYNYVKEISARIN